MLSRLVRQFSQTVASRPIIASNVPFVGPLLDANAQIKPQIGAPKLAFALIPRRNPFLRPIEAWLRNFQTFQPQRIIHVNPHLLDAPFRKDIMHRVVQWYRASLRAGTASSKARGEVRGSSRKIRQQKGTGKARAGSIRAPQRRGGGRVFGPKPRDFYYSLNPKIRALGLRSALTAKFKQGQLTFIDRESLQMDSHKTAKLVSILDKIPVLKKKILVLDTEAINRNLCLASQSLKTQFTFINVREQPVNVYHILDHSFVLVTDRALNYFQNWLTKGL